MKPPTIPDTYEVWAYDAFPWACDQWEVMGPYDTFAEAQRDAQPYGGTVYRVRTTRARK